MTPPEQVSSDPVQPTRDLVTVINGSPIAQFVQSYQFDASDEGIVYTPTVAEQCMIEDAICSFISDSELLSAALSAARSAPEAGKAVDAPRAIACDEDNMPERIWAGDFDESGFGHCVAGMQGGLYAEYVRADLASVPAPSGEPVAWEISGKVSGQRWFQSTPHVADADRSLVDITPLYAAPQAVPAEDIAGLIQRLRDRASGYRSSRFLTIPSGLLDEAAAALTLLAACLRRERECYEHSEAEASDLRRKLEEERKANGKMHRRAQLAEAINQSVEGILSMWVSVLFGPDGKKTPRYYDYHLFGFALGDIMAQRKKLTARLAASPSAQTDGGGDA